MWEVLGFEKQLSPDGVVTGVSLHCSKPIKADQGSGQKVKTFWYRPSQVAYEPSVGDRVIVDIEVRGQYQIVTDIQMF